MTTTEMQTTLLTSHKGVDLHAATALMVMKERLDGGDQLEGLLRCEVHSFIGEPRGWDADRLLHTGIYFNPNKHHYGIFRGSALNLAEGSTQSAEWLASVVDTDLTGEHDNGRALADALLGGAGQDDCSFFDVVSYASGQTGPVKSGVLWRLVIAGDDDSARKIGASLAVARGRKEGLLINPHMESWSVVDR